jgi:hypothetical protein
MNEPHYRWIRHHLLTMPPEQFDYSLPFASQDGCGCVAVQIAKHKALDELCPSSLTLMRFLGITRDEAGHLYVGLVSDGSTYGHQENRRGTPGILRAVRCLDEIAATYGLSPDAPPDPPAWTPDEAAFVARLKAEMETV